MKKPNFELSRVLEGGVKESAEIVPVTSLPWEMTTDRRGFLGAGLLAGAALVFLQGCATGDKNKYKIYDEATKSWKYYTLPCGSPIPPGAVCTCNCVPGAPAPSYGTRTICTCNKVCTCVPVYR
jgi:hypothetical protein